MFNLQANLNLNLAQGATSRIKSQIQSTLGGIKGVIDLQVSPRAQADIARLGQNLAVLQTAVRGLNTASAQAAASVDRLAGSTARAGTVSQTAAVGIGASGGAARRAAAAYTEGADAATNFGRQVGLATRRFIAFSVGAGAIYGLIGAFRSGIGEAINFDLQLNKLAQVADDGTRGVQALRAEIGRLSTSLGVSSSELADAAVTLTQAGISARDSAKAMEAFALSLLAPNFDSAKQTMEGMVAIYQQFGKNVTELKEKMGAINAVAGAFAVEAGDLVTAVQRAGGVFSTTGGKLEELIALMTAVRSTTRESSDQIATGLRSIFTYIQRSDTVENLKNLNIHLRYTREEAKALGDINLTDQFVGPYQAVMRLSQGLAKLRSTDPRYSQVVEDLGGVRQVSRVLPLVQQFTVAQQALNVARLGGASLEQAAALRQDTIANRLTKVREVYQKLANDLVQSKGFKAFVESMTTLATALADVAKYAAPLIPVLGAIATARLGMGIGRFAYGFATPSQYQPMQLTPPGVRRKFATGGYIPLDAGVPNHDSVPAMLMPGEFVMRKSAVDKIGLAKLQQMNVRGYANGGLVRGYKDGGKIEQPPKFNVGHNPLAALSAAEARVGQLFTTTDKLFEKLYRMAMRVAENAASKSGRVGVAASVIGDANASQAGLVGLVRGINSYKLEANSTPEGLGAWVRKSVNQAIVDASKQGDVRLTPKTLGKLAAEGHINPEEIKAKKGNVNTEGIKALRSLIRDGGKSEELVSKYNISQTTYDRLSQGYIKGARPRARGEGIDYQQIDDNEAKKAGTQVLNSESRAEKRAKRRRESAAIDAKRQEAHLKADFVAQASAGASAIQGQRVEAGLPTHPAIQSMLARFVAGGKRASAAQSAAVPLIPSQPGQLIIPGENPPGRPYTTTDAGFQGRALPASQYAAMLQFLALQRNFDGPVGQYRRAAELPFARNHGYVHSSLPKMGAGGGPTPGELAKAGYGPGSALVPYGPNVNNTPLANGSGYIVAPNARQYVAPKNFSWGTTYGVLPPDGIRETSSASPPPYAMRPQEGISKVEANLNVAATAAFNALTQKLNSPAEIERKNVERYQSSVIAADRAVREASLSRSDRRLIKGGVVTKEELLYGGGSEERDKEIAKLRQQINEQRSSTTLTSEQTRQVAALNLLAARGSGKPGVPFNDPSAAAWGRVVAGVGNTPFDQRLRDLVQFGGPGGLAGGGLGNGPGRGMAQAMAQAMSNKSAMGSVNIGALMSGAGMPQFGNAWTDNERLNAAVRDGIGSKSGVFGLGGQGANTGIVSASNFAHGSEPEGLFARAMYAKTVSGQNTPYDNSFNVPSDVRFRQMHLAELLNVPKDQQNNEYVEEMSRRSIEEFKEKSRNKYTRETSKWSRKGMGAADIVSLRTEATAASLGININSSVAPAIQAQLFSKEMAAAQKSLTATINRQLEFLTPQLESTQRLTLAQEMAAEALEKNAATVSNPETGELGLDSLGKEITNSPKAKGSLLSGEIDALGRGRFGRWMDRRREQYGRAMERLGSGGWLSRRVADAGGVVGKIGNKLTANGGTPAILAATTLAPIIGSEFAPDKNGASIAATTGNTKDYIGKSAIGGVAQSAAMGAGIGLIFGPMGAVYGSAIGAVLGFASSVRQAGKDIAEAKLANSLEKLGEYLKPIAEGKTTLSSSNQSGILDELMVARVSAENKARESVSGWFSSKNTIDEKTGISALGAARTKELRVALGGQAGNIVNAITGEAQRLAKASELDGISPEVLAKTRLNTGVTGELLRITADIRNVPLAKVLEEFSDTIKEARENIKVIAEIERAKTATESSITAFDRLASAVSNASLTSDLSRARGELSSVAFGGQVPSRINGYATGLSQLGAPVGNEFDTSLNSLKGLLGQSGSPLIATGQSLDRVARILPGVLADLKEHGVDLEETPAKQARDLLVGRLTGTTNPDEQKKYLADNPELARVIDVVVGGISKLEQSNKGDAFKGAKTDTSKLAQDLLAPVAEPFNKFAAEMANKTVSALEAFNSGLETARQQLVAIADSRNRVDELSLGAIRARAELRSNELGGGDPARLLSLDELIAPFQAKQSRLLAGTGLGNTDVGGISARLASVRSELETARDARDAAASGNRDAVARQQGNDALNKDLYTRAAANFDRLNNEANNLQTALKNLADPMQRAAAIQERLNALSADRDSRLGFARRYLTAAPQERARLARGQKLAAQLNDNPSLFGGLSDDDKRLALEAADLIGDSKFKNGRTGRGLATELLKTTNILPAGLEDERKGLLQQKVEVADQAVVAQKSLADDLSSQNARFVDNLYKAHDRFFQRLEQNLATEQLTRMQVAYGTAKRERDVITGEQLQANVLGKAGITKQADLDKARKYQSDVSEYFRLKEELRVIDEADSATARNILISRASAGDAGDIVPSYSAELEASGRKYLQAGSLERNVTDLGAFITPGDRFRNSLAQLQRRDTAIQRVIEGSGVTAGMSPEDRSAVVDYVNKNFRAEYDKRLKEAGSDDDVTRRRVASEAIAELTTQKAKEQAEVARARVATKVVDVASRLNISGSPIDTRKLDSLTPDEQKRFQTTLDTGFRDPAKTLDNLADRTIKADESIRNFDESIKKATIRLNELAAPEKKATEADNQKTGAYLSGLATGKSAGGAMFKPMGTDTVPAMLTPGEFVVNARASKKNLELLRSLNAGGYAAGGRVRYLANGGFVNEDDEFRYLEQKERSVNEGIASVSLTPDEQKRLTELRTSGRQTLGAAEWAAGRINAASFQSPARKQQIAGVRNDRLSLASNVGGSYDNETKYLRAANFAAGADPGGEVALDRAHDAIKARGLSLIANGKMKAEDLPRFTGRELKRLDGRRQINSLLYQQSLAGAATAPGEEEQFGASIGRIGASETRNARLFRERFGPGFRNLAKNEAERARAEYNQRQENRANKLEKYLGGKPKPIPQTGTQRAQTVIGANGVEERFRRYAAGGLVSGGIPGRDSVPGLLMPGEFVIPADSVASHGISRVRRFAAGGLVGDEGAPRGVGGTTGIPAEAAQAMARFAEQASKLSDGLSGFVAPAQSLVSGFTLFGSSVDKLVGALEKFPTNVEHSHRVTAEVIVNGSEAFAGMEEKFKGMMVSYVTGAVHDALEQRFPEAPGAQRSNPSQLT